MSPAQLSARTMPGDRPPEPDAPLAQLDQLFRQHGDFVWRVLRRFGMSEAEAEDGVQEVFLVVAHKLDTYEDRGTARAWLFAIARQVARASLRKVDRRRARVSLMAPPPPDPDPQQLAEQRQAAELVERFVDSLPEPQATVFILSEIEGMSVPEISLTLGLRITTVYGRQRLARRRFDAFVRRHQAVEDARP